MTRIINILFILTIITLSTACGSFGEEEQCPPPVGTTYTVEPALRESNCPSELTADLVSGRYSETIDSNATCGATTQIETETFTNGCTGSYTAKSTLTADGYEDASLTLTISCPNSSQCTAIIDFFYTER